MTNPNVKHFLRAFLVAATSIVAGCASFTAALSPTARPTPDTSYLYGRFTLRDTTMGIGHLRMGLGVSGASEYTIEFKQNDPVVVIAVSPGSFSLAKLVFATYDYASAGEQPITDPMLGGRFSVEPGKAYYIGDYIAETGARTLVWDTTQSWRLASIEDAFERTTANLKEQYPGFQEIEAKRAAFLEASR